MIPKKKLAITIGSFITKMKEQKITTQWIKKAIRLGEEELKLYQAGSKKWLLIYEQLEILREWLK